MNTKKLVRYLSVMLVIISQFGCSATHVEENYGEITLNEAWKIQAQNRIRVSDQMVSTSAVDVKSWISIELPSTVLNGLVKAGVYNNIYYSDNLAKIDTNQFNQAWWYRTEFDLSKLDLRYFYKLVFEGVNYRANIWLNGNLIADTNSVEGAFGIWDFEINKFLKEGDNVLAIQIFPPKFDDLTIGFVDWNPAAPDKNMGLWRPVKLLKSGEVSIQEPFVKSKINLETLADAKLYISSKIKNNSSKEKQVNAIFKFDNKEINKKVVLKPNQEIELKLNPTDFKELVIDNPKLWWPNLMGKANLYTLNSTIEVNGMVSDSKTIRFGIRDIQEYWTEDNHRGYKVNGKKVLIKGAGWVDDILLADSDEKVRAQVEYVKHMNMNCIRLEGFWGNNKTLYEAADELGVLLMIGWSCHWEWEGYCGRPNDNFMAIRTAEDQELQARAFQDQVRWLRNHPSVFLWVYGSDKLPLPELETKLNEYVTEVDDSRPILASCKYEDFDIVRNDKGEIIEGYINESEISGPTGVKMLGPYAYTAPLYWYVDKKAGGAFGFNTETGPGAQVPPIESIKKMIPEDKLWPMNEIWEYHNGRNEFSSLDRDIEAFNARYGEVDNVEDFAFNSQISNYEAMRAMFEAFEVNKHETTGLIQWMLNSAWPEMFWQLYDWYLLPNGAFYGTKTANQPLNAVYNYGDKNIYLSNSYTKSFKDIELQVKVLDIDSKILLEKKIGLNIEENSSKLAFNMPEFENLSSTYFIDLQIMNNQGKLVSNNFYWLSTKADVIDWENSKWFYSPYKSYADFSALKTMPKAKVEYKFTNKKDENGNTVVYCNLENKSNKIAFFIELAAIDQKTQETIVPVFWNDNYISLLPGEKREMKAVLKAENVKSKEIDYRIKGFNVELE